MDLHTQVMESSVLLFSLGRHELTYETFIKISYDGNTKLGTVLITYIT